MVDQGQLSQECVRCSRRSLTRAKKQYNYILATALTSAISLFGVLWFFAILYNGYEPTWWGNTVSYAGCDANQCPYLPMPSKGYFGPAVAANLAAPAREL